MEEIPEVLPPKVNAWAQRKILRMKYRNLVFKGGGVRGIAYIGALEELETLGLVEKVQRVAGSSVGAIAAMMISLRLPVDEIKRIFDTLEFSRIPQTRGEGSVEKLIDRLDLTVCSQRLFKGYGWYSSDYFYQWLQTVIAEYGGGNPRATFADFKRLGHRDPYIVVSNLSRRRSEVMTYDTTPHVAVADAVRMSMSIPLFFEALRFDGKKFGEGDLYVDGGLFDNYPLHVFDKPSLIHRNIFLRKGINWQTLGFYLYPGDVKGKKQMRDAITLIEFINLLMDNLYASNQLTAYEPNDIDQKRTIRISDCGVAATHFNIAPESNEYRALYESGRKAVREFFRAQIPEDAMGPGR